MRHNIRVAPFREHVRRAASRIGSPAPAEGAFNKQAARP